MLMSACANLCMSSVMSYLTLLHPCHHAQCTLSITCVAAVRACLLVLGGALGQVVCHQWPGLLSCQLQSQLGSDAWLLMHVRIDPDDATNSIDCLSVRSASRLVGSGAIEMIQGALWSVGSCVLAVVGVQTPPSRLPCAMRGYKPI